MRNLKKNFKFIIWNNPYLITILFCFIDIFLVCFFSFQLVKKSCFSQRLTCTNENN